MSTTALTTTTHRVTGLTCGHCVAAVQREVGAIDGVTAVAVELATGELFVTSSRAISHRELYAAVDEAGYVLAS